MRKPVGLLIPGLVLLTVFLMYGFTGTREKKGRPLPQYDGYISVNGLTDSVTLLIDERGMPHIYATCEHDLYLATGYIAARERLWQMDLVRRSAAGRLSEIFGKSFLEADIFTRCLQIYDKSKRILQDEEPGILQCLQAYTDGVNAFISSAGKDLPVEFRLLSYKPEPWRMEDIVSIIGLLGWNLDCRNLTAELFIQQLINKFGTEKATELIPDWQAAKNIVYPGPEINDTIILLTRSFVTSYGIISDMGIPSLTSSNNWAVSGSRSETGKPLLSNDIHLNLPSPEYPIGGSDHTVCPYFTYKNDFKAVNGASMRYIYNTADWDESFSVIPGGASGVPHSEFWLSQAETYLQGGFYKDHFSDAAVREAAIHTLILKPEQSGNPEEIQSK